MKIKGAIFDLDGTLLDSSDLWLNAGKYYLESLPQLLKPVEENLGAKLMEMNMSEGAQYLINAYDLKLSVNQVCDGINETLKKFYAEKIQLKTGAKEFLEFLNEENVKLSVATSTDRILFEPCLKRNGIFNFFENIFTCSELKTSKSKPIIFLTAASKMNCSPEETLVFEDAPYALETAKTSGFITVGVKDEITAASTSTEKILQFSDIFIEDFVSAKNKIML